MTKKETIGFIIQLRGELKKITIPRPIRELYKIVADTLEEKLAKIDRLEKKCDATQKKYMRTKENLEAVLAERKNEVCGKCAYYDRRFSYCNKLGVTFSDDDFCSYFEQKEGNENDEQRSACNS